MNAACWRYVTGAGVVEIVPVQEQEPVDGRQDRRLRPWSCGKPAINVFTDSRWSGMNAAM